MTVASELYTVEYTGNGVTTSFAVPYEFISADHLNVYRVTVATGAAVALNSSEYTVSGGNGSTGAVVYQYLGSPISSSYKIVIDLDVPYTQELDLAREGGFFPDAIEQQLDLIVMQIKQLRRDLADAVSGGTITSITDALSGPASSGADNFAGFNGTTGQIIKDLGYGASHFALASHSHTFASLTGKPTTIGGFGITDLQELVEDYVSAMIALGTHSGVSIDYADGTGALSFTNTATAWADKAKSTGTDIASNTVLAADADLQFIAAANTKYAFEATLVLDISSSSGVKIGVSAPTSPSALRVGYKYADSNSTTSDDVITAAGQMYANTPAATRNAIVKISGTLETGGNSGILAITFAQNVSSLTVLTIRAGSTLRYREV